MIPIVTVVAFTLMGIEGIADEIEMPFGRAELSFFFFKLTRPSLSQAATGMTYLLVRNFTEMAGKGHLMYVCQIPIVMISEKKSSKHACLAQTSTNLVPDLDI